jgi:ribose 5-phosphate isomerase A
LADATDAAKERAGRHAAEYVSDGMRVGLGTGSTVYYTILALGERRADISCVATSRRTEALARELGLRVSRPDEIGRLDLAIDGADEVDRELNLVKGGGGALTREKIVAEMADRFVVVVDESKLVERLGAFGLPIEVLRFAPGIASDRIRALGASRIHRRPGLDDNQNVLLDAFFGTIEDPESLGRRLDAIPGLVEHGLFLATLVERVVVGRPGGVRELLGRRGIATIAGRESL